jgi:ABC-type lipoprotein release transport system permease subunit
VEWGIADMDIYVSRVNNTSEKQSGLLDYLEKDDRVDYFYAALTDSVYYKTEGLSGNVLADIYENEILSDMEETIVEGRNPENLEEIAIGTRFARNNNVSLGEKIEIAHGNNSSTYTVCGIYASYKDSANSVRYIVDDIVKYFDNKADGYYSIVLKNNSELSAVIADLSAFEDYRFIPMRRSLKSIINSIIVPVAIMVMALILTFMAIIRVLLTVMIISRRKELVTYSYYGATKRDICSNVRASILAPAIIGTAIAIPISILYIPMLFKDIVFELGMKTVPIYPSIISVTISIFIMIAFTVVTLNKRSIVRLMNQ